MGKVFISSANEKQSSSPKEKVFISSANEKQSSSPKEKVFIGTSGFSYSHWGKGVFYPPNLPQKDWLRYYAKYFDTVEINATFYHQMKRETFENWRRIVGPKFVFSIKGNRFITHIKKLKDCQKEVERFFEAAGGIRSGVGGGRWEVSREVRVGSGEKGNTKHSPSLLTSRPASHFSSSSPNVILWQLPPGMKADPERLKEFLKILPKDWRYAFEFRNESWLNDKVYDLLRKYNVGVVFQDYPDWPITEQVTADFVYLRFHGRQALYSSCYTQRDLEGWAEKIRGWIKKDLDVYTYFNNDALGYAVENAKQLKTFLTAKRSFHK